MAVRHVPLDGQEPPPVPAPVPTPGTLMVDTARKNCVGEFRGVAGPYWALRPVSGGQEWEAEPQHVRLADDIERLHAQNAQNARCNARSRGEVL
ncbi:hypothetical protein [Streptomyces sp. ITFR-6]|uniref:hypothetical protein n=1 Tax=Streptomyces sp. ITFR-6 TaxID=3075197 RepID=UPI002889152A|nr:hypothetical protein [Streptomyces sp. ITFR-6]WNI30184.1 hypothetical protein RLT59_16340 [Streptomyces sp. ITFR-6]